MHPRSPASNRSLHCGSSACAVLVRLAAVWLLAGVAGCSFGLMSSPERPLSKRDMTARVLTRDATTRFLEATAHSTDNILRSETDPAVINNTLRWEVNVIVMSRNAETQLAPMMTLLDTWALALQFQAFVAEGGPGAALFGTHQAAVREITANYADDVQRLAHSLLSSKELREYQSFINDYVRTHPLQDLRFARASVVSEWTRVKGTDSKLLDEVGTIPQALADGEQRLQIYGETVPLQSVRRTQLALREAGYAPEDMRAAMARLDARLERLTTVAESAPELVRGAEQEVRESLHEIINRLDASVAASAAAFHSEREALFADLHTEREALTAAVDVQRKALTADAGRIADHLVQTSGEQVRRLTREALLLLVLLALVVLGLPFAAGYLVGRARSTPRSGSLPP